MFCRLGPSPTLWGETLRSFTIQTSIVAMIRYDKRHGKEHMKNPDVITSFLTTEASTIRLFLARVTIPRSSAPSFSLVTAPELGTLLDLELRVDTC